MASNACSILPANRSLEDTSPPRKRDERKEKHRQRRLRPDLPLQNAEVGNQKGGGRKWNKDKNCQSVSSSARSSRRPRLFVQMLRPALRSPKQTRLLRRLYRQRLARDQRVKPSFRRICRKICPLPPLPFAGNRFGSRASWEERRPPGELQSLRAKPAISLLGAQAVLLFPFLSEKEGREETSSRRRSLPCFSER